MRKQRVLAVLLALTLLVGLLPTAALAAEGDVPAPQAAESSSIVGTAYSDKAGEYEIYPVPHSVTYPGGQFTLSDDVNVVVGDGVDQYTTAFLQELLERFDRSMSISEEMAADKSNIVLAIDDTMTESDGRYDPYTLTAQDGAITITGMDADCVYYGVATLQMMFTSFNAEKFLNVSISDYSNTIFRGFIEGFYGGFDYTGRESQIRSIRDVKGNMYVFASKTDSYHGGANWDKAYPADEAADIQELIAVCDAMKVNYVWSLHIGKAGVLGSTSTDLTDAEYEAARDKVLAKFESLYGLGVRGFQILNDDSNSGTNTDRVRLLNDVNTWLKTKGDCMPLIYCCAGYNTAWAGNGSELTALQGLQPDIYLYWTGADVNSPITQSSVDWARDRSNHSVVTWLNYPCSEHCDGRGIFLGDISYYVPENALTDHCGILSNAIDSPEANKVAYFQLLSWAWNRDNYTGYLEDLWEDCFKYLQPEVYQSYLTIARNVSDCPRSRRIGSGFPESEYIKDGLEAVQTALLAGKPLAEIPQAAALLAEFDNILAAVADFRANCANPALLAELEPWLQSLSDVTLAAKDAMLAADKLASGSVSATWNYFSEGAIALAAWDSYPSSNPYVTGNAEAGSKRLQPFANTILNDYVKPAMTERFSPGGDLGGGEWAPIIRTAGQDRPNNANAQKMFDGDPTSYADYGENQVLGDYIGVDLGEVKTVTAIDILQGQSDTDHDYFHKAAVEYSLDGSAWTTLVTKVNSHHIALDGLNLTARYVRMRLLEVGYQGPNFEHNGGANYWTYIREFTVTTKDPGLIYTNLADFTTQPTLDGGAYTLPLTGVTLAAGDYVGVKFPALMGIRTLSAGTLPAGVTLEWSVDGQTWTATAPTQTTLMGYARLRATAAADLSGVTLTAALPVTTNLSFVESNVGVSQGAWENVVDGDRTTLVHTNTKQAYGQYAIFDLGGVQPVHDVTVFIPENGDDIPHNLDVFVGSSPNADGEWTQIGQLLDNSYDVNIPNRFFVCDGEGRVGRYIKLAIANVEASKWFQINELEVNTTVPQETPLTAVSATSGDAAAANDGSLLSFLTPDEASSGSWQKLLQAPTAFDAVTVLRGGASGASATVEALKQDGSWQSLGKLTQSATVLPLSDLGAITGLRITWTASDVPAIAEVIFAGEALPAGDVPLLLPNIYELPADPDPAPVTVPNGTALSDIPLPDRVTVPTSSGAEVAVPVTWTCDDYASATAGTYTFSGAFDAAAVNLSNPGCFTLSAQVTVNPAASTEPTVQTGVSLLPESPQDDVNVWASGKEVTDQNPALSMDGNTNTLWSGNKMKDKDGSTLYDTLTDAVSWITIDLGEHVTALSEIVMQYNANVWPTDYYIQVGGSTISYADYQTPGDTTTLSTDGVRHTKNDEGWVDLYHGTRTAVSDSDPTFTVSAADLTIPDGMTARYLRLYFTGINSYARAGTGIGLKELTVTGSRAIPPADPNVASVAAATASGVVGDPFDSLALPETVIATLADGTSVRAQVTWDGTDYDPEAPTQTLSGALTLPSGITNTGNVAATLTLTLTAAPTVTSATVTPAQLTATQGTSFASLALPDQAVVELSDGSVLTLDVTWDEAGYDPDTTAAQTLSGSVTLPRGGSHSVTLTLRLTALPTPAPDDPVTPDDPDPVKPTTGGSSGSSDAAVTTVQKRPDGATVTTVVDANGSRTQTVSQPDGTKAEAVTAKNGDVTITVTDPQGEELAKVALPAAIPASETEFEDLDAVPWAQEAVNNVAALKLVQGIGGNKYDPVTPMTRGSLATVLFRLSNGKSTGLTTDFADVDKDGWYADSVAWAAKAGVVQGIQGDGQMLFWPNDIITREQLAVMLARYAKLIGLDTTADASSLNAFTDGAATGSWAVDGVAWCVEQGILKGKGQNDLDPTADVSRAEVAVMLDRFIALIK